MGDFNVNLINYYKNRGTYEFLEQLFNHNFTPQIALPTRITEKTATLTDVFVNDLGQKYNSGNIMATNDCGNIILEISWPHGHPRMKMADA